MHINKKINKSSILYFSIFFIFLLIGLNSYKDYGVSIDENWLQISGVRYYSFFKGLSGGQLLLNSTYDSEKSNTNLTIENFKCDVASNEGISLANDLNQYVLIHLMVL